MKGITVRELAVKLMTMNPKAYIALSSDGEGNSFSLMADEDSMVTMAFMKNELGSQETYFDNDDIAKYGKQVKDFYGNKVDKKDLVECVVLWPSS